MKGIAFSQQDPAGRNIFEALLDKGFKAKETVNGLPVYFKDDFVLFEFKKDVISPENLDDFARAYDLELIAIASRHASKSGRPTLTVHPTGNFGEAKFGGEGRTLQKTNANAMRNVYLQLLNEPPEGYEVSMEVTHHGPTKFETPLFFAEIGSTEKQWSKPELGEFVADAITQGLSSKEEVSVVIGFGGNHYASKFSKIEEDLAFGHMCPKYALDDLKEDTLRQMIKKTVGEVEQAILDEKGMKGAQKAKVKRILGEMGLEYGIKEDL